MLYLIGLGLGDINDVSVKGLDIIKKSDEVFLEYYTSILYGNQNVTQLVSRLLPIECFKYYHL